MHRPSSVTDAHTREVALAVDVGGTKVRAALIDRDGGVLTGSTRRAATGPLASRSELIAAVDHVARSTLAAAGEGCFVQGAGIGSAGPIDLIDGTVYPKNLPRLAAFELRHHIELLLQGKPVVLRLDGTCIALAEYWLGATKGFSNSMSMVVSTGIGGGLILHDRLVSGRSGNSGHVGQIQIATRQKSGDHDASTLEAIASGPRTVRWAIDHGWVGTSGEDLSVSCASGDPVAVAAVKRSATAVGEAVSSVTTLLDLDIVAIGGGFVNVSCDYVDLVAETVRDVAIFDYSRDLSVVRSSLGDDGPLLGAAALIHCPELLLNPLADPVDPRFSAAR